MTIRVDGGKLYLYLYGGWRLVGDLSNRILTIPKPSTHSATFRFNYNLLQEARLFDKVVVPLKGGEQLILSRERLANTNNKTEENHFEKEVEFTLEELKQLADAN